MKNFAMIAAAIAMTATSAAAMSSPVALSSATQSQIRTLVPEADMTGISTAQYAQLVALFANSDNLRSGNNPEGKIRVILKSN